ncbi:glycosyltransferase [Clostridium chauvoei]|uniref:Glycosyltransferase n=2 Tax=Clostridium chauvoei TaxID=46867 RepID=A0ABD4RE29_9CLOT|nr:glycosyltransferase [Clostridium chauvoei]ATD55235.1 glycosyl transferase family 1 [Clostridium chauvoei]ATD57093.1 glycosyl transferase family 1 [Clostridium chauvoei]MBX7279580.1 glycosyltransferase [Clostridium chauvoei]MBX7281949.1 glycosyltransferase [Clostridium chauvoei]MBX7284462.1 glycosyltransferase [Clostridium chauvoei]
MHIMFVPSWYNNARNKVHGSFFKEQAMALQEAGVKITVAYNEIWPLTLFGKVKEKSGLNINVEDSLKTYRYKNYNFIPKSPLMFKVFNRRMDKIYKEIVKREGKVDVIHAQSSLWGGISAAYVAKKYNIPLVITEHSSVERGKYLRESYKPFIKESYLLADELIVVGNGLKKELSKFSGRNDIKVIHNLIHFDLFNIKKVTNKEFVFFSLAFLEGEKGMDTLIKSFSKGFKDTNCKLKIGGDGSQKEELMNLAKKLGVINQVEFLGALSREEVSKNMSDCNAFVLASKYETFGVVYIEALASGKPVIGTFNGGAEDIINSSNGILVKVDDINGLKYAMEYIKENIDKFSPNKIRQDCENRFSKNIIVEKILEVYKEVMKIS